MREKKAPDFVRAVSGLFADNSCVSVKGTKIGKPLSGNTLVKHNRLRVQPSFIAATISALRRSEPGKLASVRTRKKRNMAPQSCGS